MKTCKNVEQIENRPKRQNEVKVQECRTNVKTHKNVDIM